MVSAVIYVNMRIMQLSVYRTNGTYAPKINIFDLEISDSVLLFGIVILILDIPNALLISVT
jgi:hypothetical protein